MEIQNSYIYNINKSNKVENGIRKFEWYQNEAEWEKEYVSEANGLKNKIYIDPDSSEAQCIPFYEALVGFLNKQEEQIKNLNGKYKYCFNAVRPYGIEVREIMGSRYGIEQISGPLFYLKSDQLGFSAPSSKNNHPYDIYIERSEDKKSAVSKVASWVYWARGIGGSFLWPMEQNGCGDWIENPSINKARGGANPFTKDKKYQGNGYDRYWIEDRVDITLLEVKRVLDYISHSEIAGSILWSNCLPQTNLMKWLRHFGTFEKYVEFFCFQDFVAADSGNMPIDIVNSKLSLEDKKQKKEAVSKEKDYKNRKDQSIFNLNSGELEQMLENVNIMIKKRSNAMKALILKKNATEEPESLS